MFILRLDPGPPDWLCFWSSTHLHDSRPDGSPEWVMDAAVPSHLTRYLVGSCGASVRIVVDRRGVALSQSGVRWVLAFDASCGSCKAIAARVDHACSGRIEVLPLSHPDVVRWRESCGSEWGPTLIRVGPGNTARTWVGRSMVVPLMRSLGPRATVSVVSALGTLRRSERDRDPIAPEADAPTGSVSRKRFLLLGAGALVAGGLVLTGRTPAYAGGDPANDWVQANLSQLPQTYEEFGSHPVDYRRAIYRALSPEARQSLWRQHLSNYRDNHPQLTSEQISALAHADSYIVTPDAFASIDASTTVPELDRLKTAVDAAFGSDESRRIIAILGPPTDSEAPSPARLRSCTCSVISDWCDNSLRCHNDACVQHGGCGTFWNYTCDGLCHM